MNFLLKTAFLPNFHFKKVWAWFTWGVSHETYEISQKLLIPSTNYKPKR